LSEEVPTVALKLVFLKMSIPVTPDCNYVCARLKSNSMFGGPLWRQVVGFTEESLKRLKQLR